MDAELEAELRQIMDDAEATLFTEASREVVYELIDAGGPTGKRVNKMMLEKLERM